MKKLKKLLIPARLCSKNADLIHFFKKYSKKLKTTALDSELGEWFGRLVMATRFLYPNRLFTAIV